MVAVALLLLALPVGAQPAATVPAWDPVYRKLEALTAFFPVPGFHVAQRPLSRAHMARVVSAIESAAAAARGGGTRNRRRAAWALREIETLRATLGMVTAAVTADASLGFEAVATSARHTRVTPNGLGELDAFTHPFDRGRYGHPLDSGATLLVSPSTDIGVGRSVGLGATAALAYGTGSDATSAVATRLHARGVLRNAAVQVGRDATRWGQSDNGAIFRSGNALALPAVTVGSDVPFTMPWLLRLAGPTSVSGFVANLGASQDPRWAKLAGWQAIVQPVSRFELAVAVLAQQGGEGAPPATLLERAIDLLPIIDALAPQRADLAISNKVAGGSLRMRFPSLSGLDVYYEMHLDDFDLRRFGSTVVDDMTHLLGARMATVTDAGFVALRAELHNTGLRVTEHFQYRSGLTYQQRFLGSHLGPNAKAVMLEGEWEPSPRSSATLRVSSELRDPSIYVSTSSGPFDEGFRFIRQTDDPDLRTVRVLGAWSRSGGRARLTVEGGAASEWRRGAAKRTSGLGRVALQLPIAFVR